MLRGKVAVITGSSRGIGRSIALAMSAQGAAVVVNGRDEQAVANTTAEIINRGGRAISVPGSVTEANTSRRLIEAAYSHFGGVHILVNNAGIVRDRISYRMTEQEWDEVIDVHLKGAFLCTQAAIDVMRSQREGGSIINMTSLAGIQGCVGQANYAAAKAGILGLTWTLALELKRFNIRVNAIAPAALTEMTRPLVEKAEEVSKLAGKPVSDYWQIGSPDDVAPLAIALSTDRAAGLTGFVFSVNGGKIGWWEPPRHHTLIDEKQASTPLQLRELLADGEWETPAFEQNEQKKRK